MRHIFFAAMGFAVIALTGCGDMPRSSIHGTVTFRGKPLSRATVIFLAKDNKTHVAKLKPDGTFAVSGVAQGLVKVSIQQDQPEVASKAPPGAASQKTGVSDEKASARPTPPPSHVKGTIPRLPELYADPEKSGLSFELTEPDQEWSIDLKDARAEGRERGRE
jgi:hypothetical protein